MIQSIDRDFMAMSARANGMRYAVEAAMVMHNLDRGTAEREVERSIRIRLGAERLLKDVGVIR